MLPKWVPLLNSSSRPGEKQYDHSLVWNVVAALLFISLIPVLLFGTINGNRSRSLLVKQVSGQMEKLLAHETRQLNTFLAGQKEASDRLAADPALTAALVNLLATPDTAPEYDPARAALLAQMQQYFPSTGAQDIFQAAILRPDGSVVVTAGGSPAADLAKDPLILPLLGTSQSFFVFNALQSLPERTVLLTSRPLVDAQGAPVATFISLSSSEQIARLLSEPGQFLDGATTYYFNRQAELFGVTDKGALAAMPINPKMVSALQSMIAGEHRLPGFSSVDARGIAILATAEWLPNSNLGILLTLPEISTVGPANMVDPASLLALLFSLLITTALIYYGSTRMVRPLIDLARLAEQFAKGNWSERSPIQRNDEIGHLAISINRMADDLSSLYYSLESAVELRTSQLRTAAEVTQVALSASSMGDTMSQTIALIRERFSFDYVALYLFDESRQNLVLSEMSTSAVEWGKKESRPIKADTSTLIGWVAEKKEVKIASDPLQAHLLHSNSLQPDTKSEITIPVTLGNEVLGVLDIQSNQADAFGTETLFVYQTLATQISSILRNARLLETIQASYKEIDLLFGASRQVAQAQKKEETTQPLIDAMLQLPFLGVILTVDGQFLRIEAITDPETRRAQTDLYHIEIPAGRVIELLEQNRLVIAEDITQPSEYYVLFSFLRRRGYTSAAVFAALANDRLARVLILATHEPSRLTPANLQPYVTLTEIIGSSFEKNQALDSLQKRLSELQTLARLNQALTAETRLEGLYPILHQQIGQALGPGLGFVIARVQPQRSWLEFPYCFSGDRLRQVKPAPLGQDPISQLIENRQPMRLTNEQILLAQETPGADAPAKSWMGIPLVFGDDVLGAMVVQDPAAENRFTEDDLNLMALLGPQIAGAMRNAQLYTEAQQALAAYDQERFLLHVLLENIPDGITFKDFQGVYIRTSDAFARTLGRTPQQVTGKTDYDLFDRETAEKIYRKDQMIMNLGRPEFGLVEPSSNRSGAAWVHTSRIPIRTSSGDPYGLMLIQRDITAMKQAEDLAQRRADQVTTASEIARDATGTLDLPDLLQKSVNLVRERFGYYHASIFLLDITGEYAVLRESTGQAGAQMLRAGHRLAAGSKSIVGQATSAGEAVIINNVHGDPTHLPNPLLPDTQSELAIPLKVGERVLGALDVQSTQVGAFTQEDVSVLTILADQLAVALVNADLFAKTQDLLNKHRMLRQLSVEASASTQIEDAMARVVGGLHQAMPEDRIILLSLDEQGVMQVHASAGYEGQRLPGNREPLNQKILDQVVAKKHAVRVNDISSDPRGINPQEPDVRSELAEPILFNDEIIGILNLKSTRPYAFDENDQEIIGALGTNLGGTIANIRLVHQVRQQVLRERQLFDITSKIRRSVDLETILETSAREIAQVLGARRASIRITAGEKETPGLPGENGKMGHESQG